MNLKEIYQVLGLSPDANSDKQIQEWVIDSRRISSPEAAIFIALAGEVRDGHDYMTDAYDKGVRYFIGSQEVKDLPEDAQYLKVPDSLNALQTLAAYNRRKYKGQVMAITGSNGKTILKEWLYYSLSPIYNIYVSPKSYNSQIGVALSLLEMDMNTDFAVIEAGISENGEMEKLRSMISPEIGILSSIGDAHEKSFDSIEKKLEEKLKLFKGCNYVFVGRVSSGPLRNQISTSLKQEGIAKVSVQSADYSYIAEEKNSYVEYGTYRYKIPFVDEASVLNSMLLCDILQSDIFRIDALMETMEGLPAVSMRMEYLEGQNNCRIISDVYSADLHSIKIALATLNHQADSWKKSIILSSLNPHHNRADEAMKEILALLDRYSFHRVILVGESWKKYLGEINSPHLEYFATREELIQALDVLDFRDEYILLKSARIYHLEDVVDMLKLQKHSVRLEVDLTRMRNNLLYYKSLLNKETKIMAMVKSESYGAGTYVVAKQLQNWGVNYLAVTYSDEGVLLRRKGIKLPIMVMNPRQEGIQESLDWSLELEIYNHSILDEIISYGVNKKLENIPIHIKFDTGMHRLGFEEEDMPELIEKLKKNSFLEIKSCFTHLHAADVENAGDIVERQVAIFKKRIEELKKESIELGLLHVLNSAGVETYSQFQFDMVRLGIGLYGLSPSKNENILPVSSYIAEVVQIKNISAGEYLGYGSKNKLDKNTRIAVINVGYADGYNRAFGNGKAYVKIGNQRAYTIGNICMDMFFVDISALENIHEGDEVCIYGDDPRADDMAENIDTIGYELLTSISNRIPRVFEME